MNTLVNSGDVLRSRYRIVRQLGRGGFSRTYLAEDINRFNEYCVLKEFAPRLQTTFVLKKAQELFEREAEVLYRLQHPQIPHFRELFQYQYKNQGHLFLVQDYIEGSTYQALFNQRASEGSRFQEAEVMHLLTKLLPVLAYIHSAGMIHRDISPDNLILTSQDQLPVLIDFGSIKEVEKKLQWQLQEVTPAGATFSLMGTAIGKTGYAPPEQIERGIVFAHSDLYALAATVVVLLTGKTPEELIDFNSYQWNWQSKVTIAPKLVFILDKMLAPNPRDRFQSATEVLQKLEDLAIAATTSPVVIKSSCFTKTKTLLTLPLTVLVMVLTILSGSIGWFKGSDLINIFRSNFAPETLIQHPEESR